MKREMYNLALSYKFPKQGTKLSNYIRQLATSQTSLKIVEQIRIAAKDADLKSDVSRRIKDLCDY